MRPFSTLCGARILHIALLGTTLCASAHAASKSGPARGARHTPPGPKRAIKPPAAKAAAASKPPGATPASAAKDRLALVFFIKDATGAELIARFRQQLRYADDFVPQVALLEDEDVHRALKADPAKAFGGCGSKLKCFGVLGQRAHATSVVLGRWVPRESGGQAMQYIVISTKSPRVLRKGQIELPDVAAIPATVAQTFAQLADVPSQGEVAVRGCSGPMMVGDRNVGAAGTPVVLAAGKHHVAVSGWSEDVLLYPGQHLNLSCSEPVAVAANQPAPPPAAEPQAAPAPPQSAAAPIAESAPAPAPPREMRPEPDVAPVAQLETSSKLAAPAWVFPTTVAVASVGVASLLAGAAFNTYGHSIAGDVHYGAAGTTQVEAAAAEGRANRAIRIGNICTGVGAGFAILGGGGLLAQRLGLFDTRQVELALHITPGGAVVAGGWDL